VKTLLKNPEVFSLMPNRQEWEKWKNIAGEYLSLPHQKVVEVGARATGRTV
jgi:hypothetical protein